LRITRSGLCTYGRLRKSTIEFNFVSNQNVSVGAKCVVVPDLIRCLGVRWWSSGSWIKFRM